tara:strand:- start:120 stop:374 length:255 start_codon:yes stop_codon:yes gene_type:complete
VESPRDQPTGPQWNFRPRPGQQEPKKDSPTEYVVGYPHRSRKAVDGYWARQYSERVGRGAKVTQQRLMRQMRLTPVFFLTHDNL